MNQKHETIRAVISPNNPWHLKDIDRKSKELGIDRYELIRQAVDMMMNFDRDFLDYIKTYEDALKIPKYLIIQNIIISKIADSEARIEVYGPKTQNIEGFIFLENEKGPKVLSGNELKEHLKSSKIEEYQKEKTNLSIYKQAILGSNYK